MNMPKKTSNPIELDEDEADFQRAQSTVVAFKAKPKKKEKAFEPFVIVPLAWVNRLVSARHIATYRVALHLLYLHWKSGGKPFTLSNKAVKGVSRWRKWEALGELEALGLIRIERRRRRSPLITVAKETSQ
jgi:hypothetical protein